MGNEPGSKARDRKCSDRAPVSTGKVGAGVGSNDTLRSVNAVDEPVANGPKRKIDGTGQSISVADL